MRYVMLALVANFRSTLDFFKNRELAMSEYHPHKFPHWSLNPRDFNLIDTDARQVIRFEPRKFIVRAEGHDNLESFNDCVHIAFKLAKESFKIIDYFAINFESMQVASTSQRIKRTRKEFAGAFLTNNALEILPADGKTDYATILSRSNEKVDKDFNIIKEGKPTITNFMLDTHITLGPVSKREIIEKWLEFKESSQYELYKTSPNVPENGIMVSIKFTGRPAQNTRVISFDKIINFFEWAKQKADSIYDNTLGGHSWLHYL